MNLYVERYPLRGLCMTCNHAAFCMHLARAEGAIWRCEEFDDSGPRGASVAAIVGPEQTTQTAEASQPDLPDNPRGLCGNCDNLPTCRFPKAKSGVWHCEEYA